MEKDFNKIIGRKIEEYRKKRHLSRPDVIEWLNLGITPQQMGHYERGEQRIPAELVCKLSIFFNIRVEVLMGMKHYNRPNREGSTEVECEEYRVKLSEMRPSVREFACDIIDRLLIMSEKRYRIRKKDLAYEKRRKHGQARKTETRGAGESSEQRPADI